MDRIHMATLLFLAALPPVALGQIPPGYFVQQITDNSFQECPPRLNDRGQIVFERRSGPGGTGELFLYDRDSDTLTQLTDDNVVDAFPDISEDGTITWTRFIGPPGQFGPTGEIMIRDPDGTVTRLTNNAVEDRASRINSLNHLTWQRDAGVACGGPVNDVFFYDGRTIQAITTDAVPNEVSNQVPALNNLDQIVFAKFDFCVNPWESEVWLFDAGKLRQLNQPGVVAPRAPAINNRSLVAWSSSDGIQIWDNNVVTLLTDWGRGPILNDDGQVAFHRWHADTQNWHQWLYRDGQFWQLSDGAMWNFTGDMNEAGEVAFVSDFDPFTLIGDISYLRRFPLGDLNCDGAVDAFDIEPFLGALFDPDQYTARYPNCDVLLADLDGDGRVNAFDIEPFIHVLFP